MIWVKAERAAYHYFTGWTLETSAGVSGPSAAWGFQESDSFTVNTATRITPSFRAASPCKRSAVLERINFERGKPTAANPSGLPALFADRRLIVAADSHSIYMARTALLTHIQELNASTSTFFTGPMFSDRIKRQGATTGTGTTEVAASMVTSDGVTIAEMWLNSMSPDPTSHRSLLMSAVGHVGVGEMGGYWTFVSAPQAVTDPGDHCLDTQATVAPAAPLAPNGLTASWSVNFKAELSWTDVASTERGYLVERCAGAGGSGFAQIDSVSANINAYQNGGLAASTSYSYRVRATNAGGRSNYSNVATIVTTALPPTAPSGLTASLSSSAVAALSWVDAATTETGFLVERCAGAGCSSFAQIDSVGANISAYQNVTLATSTSYSYRVRATNAGSRSGYSNITTIVTVAPPPAAPSGLNALSSCSGGQCSSGRIDLTWTDNALNEETYRIVRCEGAACTNFAEIGSVGNNIASFTDRTVAVGVSYSYRVAACRSGGGCSSPSNSASTSVSAGKPAAPTALVITTVSRTQINLSWTDTANNETSFRIDRCTGPGCTSFTEIASVGANMTSYQNSGLLAGTSYTYRVRAVNGAGGSSFTNAATSKTTP
ncbi:MAG: fibronectin type III domain-containing protein [Gemmatimonadaceae bacterium]|nr:fibronectin type III domain-containing protein [Gemmatimonadaceae bacterium]